VNGSTPPTLELRGISKSFGSVQALLGADFEVRDGEVMALVGDNGAGKSTLIKCVAGIYSIDDGEVLFRGRPVKVHGPKDAAKLGIEVVYQDLALCDNLDVVQNMYLGREANRFEILTEPPMEAKTRETLATLRVTTIKSIRQAVATLSGGQRKLLELARVLMAEPAIILLDEPAAGVNLSLVDVIIARILEINRRGTTFLVIEHNMRLIMSLASHLDCLAPGKLLSGGSPDAVRKDRRVVDAYLGATLASSPAAGGR